MKEYLDKSLTYAEYIQLIDSLLDEGKTTGPNQSDAMLNYARLNRRRMQRLDKTAELIDGVRQTARLRDRKMIWLTITEGWCGDAAQNIPFIEKIAAESGNIKTRYILRDENLELMDRFLTGGARSIPKLIALDAETLEVLWTWGARPAAAHRYFLEMKGSGLEKSEISENLQRWYNEDKGRSIQEEFELLIAGGKRSLAMAAGAESEVFV